MERFFSKTILVDTESSYRAIHTNSKVDLNLIPRFSNDVPLYRAVSNGHHVIVPLGGDDPFNNDMVTPLDIIDKKGQIEGLMEMGLSQEDAERYSHEAARDITILRRLLQFQLTSATWSKESGITELIPALLIGRWHDKSMGNREIIEKTSGCSYEDFTFKMSRWLTREEPPLLYVGDLWRLTSPVDLWTTISSVLSFNDLNSLADIAITIYNEPLDESNTASFFTKPPKYSKWMREGVAQSLLLVAVYGQKLQISDVSNAQELVDHVVANIMKGADGQKWKSLDQQLPLLSEASPESFLEAVKSSLDDDIKSILKMFEAKESFLNDLSYHTGLLWALEGLSWLPKYLYDATLILLKLSRLDPGGNLHNRPSNSLLEIYMPWHHQTLAGFDDRMEVLATAVKIEKESGCNLLIGLLPNTFGIASPTHKLRWRMFGQNTTITHTYEETFATYSKVTDLLKEIYNGSELQLGQLIEHSVDLTINDDRDKLLDFIEVKVQDHKPSEILRTKLREILAHHRAYPDADWAMPEILLQRYQKLYDLIEPNDLVQKSK